MMNVVNGFLRQVSFPYRGTIPPQLKPFLSDGRGPFTVTETLKDKDETSYAYQSKYYKTEIHDIINTLTRQKKITDRESSILIQLLHYQNKKTGILNVTNETLAEVLGISIKTLKRALYPMIKRMPGIFKIKPYFPKLLTTRRQIFIDWDQLATYAQKDHKFEEGQNDPPNPEDKISYSYINKKEKNIKIKQSANLIPSESKLATLVKREDFFNSEYYFSESEEERARVKKYAAPPVISDTYAQPPETENESKLVTNDQISREKRIELKNINEFGINMVAEETPEEWNTYVKMGSVMAISMREEWENRGKEKVEVVEEEGPDPNLTEEGLRRYNISTLEKRHTISAIQRIETKVGIPLDQIKLRMLQNPSYDPFSNDRRKWIWNEDCHPQYALMNATERFEHLQKALKFWLPNDHGYWWKGCRDRLIRYMKFVDEKKGLYEDWLQAAYWSIPGNKLFLNNLVSLKWAEVRYNQWVEAGCPFPVTADGMGRNIPLINKKAIEFFSNGGSKRKYNKKPKDIYERVREERKDIEDTFHQAMAKKARKGSIFDI